MRIPSGVTDQVIYFVAVDSTDLKTRETGLSSFTVYRSRDGAAAVLMTPVISETDATNMPGVYDLLLDEDMTIGSGNDSEEMCFHITQASMAPVTRTIELYRSKITAGNTLGVASDGDVSGNVDGNVVGSVASVTGAVASVTAAIVLPGIPTNWITAAGINASALDGKGNWNIGKTGYALTTADWNVGKTGYSISGTITTLDGLNDVSAADVNAQCDIALNATDYTDPGQVEPSETSSIVEKVGQIHKTLINRSVGDATGIDIFNAAETVVDQKRVVSLAAGIFTQQKILQGP